MARRRRTKGEILVDLLIDGRYERFVEETFKVVVKHISERKRRIQTVDKRPTGVIQIGDGVEYIPPPKVK